MRKSRTALGLILSTVLLAASAHAAPSRFTIENAALQAGCEMMSNRQIRMVSQSGGFPPQFVYRVECQRIYDSSYIIIVCEGDFTCWAG